MIRKTNVIPNTVIATLAMAGVVLMLGIIGLVIPDLLPLALREPKISWSFIAVGMLFEIVAVVQLIRSR